MLQKIDLEQKNNTVDLLNRLFAFREEYSMNDDCILDVLEEFAHKHDLDASFLAMELSDLDGFVDLVEVDLKRFKYNKGLSEEPINDGWD